MIANDDLQTKRQASETGIESPVANCANPGDEDTADDSLQGLVNQPSPETRCLSAATDRPPRKIPNPLDIRDESLLQSEALRHRTTFHTASSSTRDILHSPVITFQGIGARQDVMNHPRRTEIRPDYTSPQPLSQSRQRSRTSDTNPSDYPGIIGRNSQFSSLTSAERDHLGGAEYRAIALLAVIVPVYFFLWQFLGALGVGAYVANNRRAMTEANGLNPW